MSAEPTPHHPCDPDCVSREWPHDGPCLVRRYFDAPPEVMDVPCPHDPTGTSPYACACEDG